MSKWSDTWNYPRLNRHLKTHYGENGELMCMPTKSDTYLFPHLTTIENDVTCEKCKELLLTNQRRESLCI